MTRLEALIEAIEDDFSQKELEEIILNNFSNQDSNTFDISGNSYFVYTNDDIKNKQYDFHEEQIYEMIIMLENSEYMNYSSLIDENNILNRYLDISNETVIDGLELLTEINMYYIYTEIQKSLFR